MHATIMNDHDLFYEQAFRRNIGILTPDEQKKIRKAKVAIVGCGGVGGSHLLSLTRLGVTQFHIADMDTFDIVNIQRQSGATAHTLEKNKALAMKEMALSINPHINVKVFDKGVTELNINEFLEGVDILLDGIDFFSVDMRRKLFMSARQAGVYTVTAGPLGFGSALMVFSPEGMSFDRYFDIDDSMTYLQKLIAFAVGLAPAALHMGYLDLKKVDPTARNGPALISSCLLSSSLAVTEVMKIVTGREAVKAAPHYFQFDPFLQKYKKGYLVGGNRHFWQKIKRRFLYRKFRDYETDKHF